MPHHQSGVHRRALLGAVGTAAATASAGCLDELLNNTNRTPPKQVSLRVKAVPADDDDQAVLLARRYVDTLEAVGIDTAFELKSETELHRDVLLNADFEIAILERSTVGEPDALRPMLHSLYAEESGWQNPFGITSPSLDEVLEEQCATSGYARERAVDDLQAELLTLQPFSVVAYPEFLAVANAGLGEAWQRPIRTPLDLLGAGPRGAGRRETLRLATTDGELSRNRNPFAVEYRNRELLLDLLYDPLARRTVGAVRPWLADAWNWGEREDGTTTLTVTLRPDLAWHDGTALTASDVAFTYRFLADTSLGKADGQVPAPRYRAQSSLVRSVSAVDDRTVRLAIRDCSREVGLWTLTAPVLPEHVWRERSVVVDDYVTRALVWENPRPVGSGPLRFAGASRGESVTLRRYADHFLTRSGLGPALEDLRGGPAFETLEVTVVPSSAAAVELVDAGDADASLGSLSTAEVARANRADDVRLLVGEPTSQFVVAFNTRSAPLSNWRFRRVLARLLDRPAVVDEVFDGYARPADSPLVGSGFVPDDLAWDGTSEVGAFPGEDGALDPAAARDLFREAGYRYDGDDRLVTKG